MFLFKIIFLVTMINIFSRVQSAPFVFDDDEDDVTGEFRRKHKNRRKPCGRNEEGRTFFPFQFSYVTVNNNYNCGGASQSASDTQHDVVQDIIQSGSKPGHFKPGGHRPHNISGGNKPSQSTNSKPEDVAQDPVDDLSTSHGHHPHRPFYTFLQNHVNGMGIFNNIYNGIFGNTNSQKPTTESVTIPVHEIQEDFITEAANNLKPGQQIAAYNPLTGQHIQSVSQINSKQLYRRLNREFDRFLRPIYHLF